MAVASGATFHPGGVALLLGVRALYESTTEGAGEVYALGAALGTLWLFAVVTNPDGSVPALPLTVAVGGRMRAGETGARLEYLAGEVVL